MGGRLTRSGGGWAGSHVHKRKKKRGRGGATSPGRPTTDTAATDFYTAAPPPCLTLAPVLCLIHITQGIRTRPQSRPSPGRAPVKKKEREGECAGCGFRASRGGLRKRRGTHARPVPHRRRGPTPPPGTPPLVRGVCVDRGGGGSHTPHPASLRTLWSAAWGALSYTATTASRRAGCQVPLKPMKSMRAGPPDAVPGKWRSRVRTPEKRVTLACVCVEGEREGRV